MTIAAKTTSERHSLRRTIAGASGFALLGRGVGLLWTVALIVRLGLSDYGLYAMAFSASSLLATFVDGPFYARSGRVTLQQFHQDTTVRALGGTLLAGGGILLLAVGWYVPGLAALLAGGEAVLGVVKARPHREGRATHEQGIDLARQFTSVLCGMTVLFAFPSTRLLAVSLAYTLPYGAAIVIALSRSIGPLRLPPLRESASLALTSAVGAGYAQLDVVVVGALLGSKPAGAYALATIAAWALALPGQQLATALLPQLRRTAAVQAHALRLATSLGIGLGGLCLAAPFVASRIVPSQVLAAQCLALLSPFVATRTVNWYLSNVAVLQKRDAARFATTAAALAVDMLLLLGLLRLLGVRAAPIAATGADIVLLIGFVWATRCSLPRRLVLGVVSLTTLASLTMFVLPYPQGLVR